MRILVTGGAGYIGSALVPQLLKDGHSVAVYDLFWFGDHLPESERLTRFKQDIRNITAWRSALDEFKPQAVIHLACISNDPSFELDESLSRTINYECFEHLVTVTKATGVSRFIYCSSSSVYGVSDAPDVREDHPLVPLTLYNKYKGMCEPLLFKHQSDDFVCVTLRPSTVCGYAPRQRLDLAANIMTNLAVMKHEITVFGGAQRRPNLHINDMVRCYQALLSAPAEKVQGQTFNVGAKNHTIQELAEIAQATVSEFFKHPVDIVVKPVDDKRSYQVNSDKIKEVLGFEPRFTVGTAVVDLCDAYKAGRFDDPLNNPLYYNVKRMHKVWAEIYKGAPPSKFDPTTGMLSEIDMLRSAGKV